MWKLIFSLDTSIVLVANAVVIAGLAVTGAAVVTTSESVSRSLTRN